MEKTIVHLVINGKTIETVTLLQVPDPGEELLVSGITSGTRTFRIITRAWSVEAKRESYQQSCWLNVLEM